MALAGVDSLVLARRPKRDQGKTRSSSVAVREFCSLPVRAHRCRTVSSFVHCQEVGFLPFPYQYAGNVARFSEVFCKRSNPLFASAKAESESWKETINVGSQVDFIDDLLICELTVCHISSWQTCKTSLEKHLVIFLTFFYRFGKFGDTSNPFSNIKVKIDAVKLSS